MFKYTSDISNLTHNIIKNYCNFNYAIDATLGNGHDTDFLSSYFKKIYSFDIQKDAVDNYKLKGNDKVILINDSHENVLNYVQHGVDCIMFNLGFLPGGDKSITTKSESTLTSIKKCLSLLNFSGIMTICIYTGHEEGKKEEEIILDFVKELPKKEYGVMHHVILNRQNNPPSLLVIEKK